MEIVEDNIKNFLKEFVESLTGKESKYYLDKNVTFIRPSGNPLNIDEWEEMFNSKDLESISSKLICINKLNFYSYGRIAVSVITIHSKFKYKGKENNDVAICTLVLENKVDRWKIINMQRSTAV
jgi:hypothetical protein